MSSQHTCEFVSLEKAAVAGSHLHEVQIHESNRFVLIKTTTAYDQPMEPFTPYVRKHHVDLIAMSSHNSSCNGRLISGRMSEKVLRSANCATLVVCGQVSLVRSRSSRSQKQTGVELLFGSWSFRNWLEVIGCSDRKDVAQCALLYISCAGSLRPIIID